MSSSPTVGISLDFSKELVGLNDVPFELDPGRNLTLKDVIVEGLLMPKPGLSPDDKFVLFQLAKDVHDGRNIMTDHEFDLIKVTIGQVYDQAIMGAAWRELDNQAAKFQSRDVSSQETHTL